MSCLDRDKTLRHLKKKGFVESKKRGKDHIHLEFYYEGKLVSHTKFSHNGDDIRDGLISMMSIECKLDKTQFMDLANCPLSKEAYLKILSDHKYLD